MTRVLRQIALLVEKDLRIEARSRQTMALVLTLGLLIVVVLGLGLGADQRLGGIGAAAVLWVAYLFGGVLCFEKTMAVEQHENVLAALLLAPVDRGTLYVGKLVSNLILMTALALVVTPAGIVLFNFDLSAAPGSFLLVVAVSMIGVAAVGTLFSAAASSARLQGGLLAVLVFPITLPLVIVSTRLLLGIFRDGEPLVGLGLAVLVAADAIFVVVSWLAFELLLEP